MIWKKKGLLVKPGRYEWFENYAILPTPFYFEEVGIIRIFFASTDKNNFGRISFIDVDSENPENILFRKNSPVLDIGEIGTFDDCGVNISCILKRENEFIVYYYGFQRTERVPYLIFSGVAVSRDCENFEKISNVPVLDRLENEPFLRSAPFVLYHKKVYKMWYVSAFGWTKMEGGVHNGRLMPQYHIRYLESVDGLKWVGEGKQINFEIAEDEFGFGRPFLIFDKGIFQMWYSIRKKSIPYRIGYAESSDGINWVRKDSMVGINVSNVGWDSEMICYPAIVKAQSKTFLFYNGNGNGKSGFGYAELVKG